MGWQITFDGTRLDPPPDRKKDPDASIWENGKVVDLGNLSPEAFEKIASDEGDDATWWLVFNFPGAKPSRFYKVLEVAAAYAGCAPPARPTTMNEAVALLDLIEKTADPTEGTSASTTPSSDGLSTSTDGSLQLLGANE